ncbi:MAG: protein kinase, partial [Chlamydiia bacterium]|nr:protein kinase [Chlamydiia bacterium]
ADLSSPQAKKVIEVQGRARGQFTMGVHPSSANYSHDIYLTPTSVRVSEKRLGRGAQGVVILAKRIFNNPTKENASEAFKIIDRKPGSWTLFENFSEEEREFINLPTATYDMDDGRFGAVLPQAEGDLKQFDVTMEDKPVRTLLGYIRDVANGAAVMHQKGLLHRDIKPDNTLVMKGKKKAQLGDLDLAGVRSSAEHTTKGTPTYMHPSIWGDDLQKQKRFRGIQTEADDVFALGRTVQYGIISKVFSAHGETKDLAQAMNPRAACLSASEDELDEELQELKESNEGPVLMTVYKKAGGFHFVPEEVAIFPSRLKLYGIAQEGIEQLEGKLDPAEILALKVANFYAAAMQNDRAENRPTMDQIRQGLAYDLSQIEALSQEPKEARSVKRQKLSH